MNCLKCGAVIPEGECFCEKCLEGMKDYPVPPDAVVYLPVRPAEPAKRSSRRRQNLSDGEQIQLLKKRLRRCHLAVAALILLELILVVASVQYFRHHKAPLPGQNYSTVVTTAPTTGKQDAGG